MKFTTRSSCVWLLAAASVLILAGHARAELLVNPSNGPWIVNDTVNEDDNAFALPITGSFPFFGATQSALYADVNGNLNFDGDGLYSDTALTISAARIAGLWDDLYIYQHSGGQILNNSAAGQYIAVTWDYEDLYSEQGSGPLTFQIVIFQQPAMLLGNSFLPGDIVLSYKSLGQAFVGDTATVGLGDGNGGEVVPAGSSDGTFSHVQALAGVPTDNHAFLFRPNESNSYDLSTITLDLTGAAPYALPDNLYVPLPAPGAAATLNVLANDYDPNGESLTITAVTDGSEGSVAISGDGQSLLYTPNAGFVGSDTFSYTVKNSDGLSSTTTVSVQFTSAPPPTAVNDFAISNGGSVTVDVLANDSDPDGLPLSVADVGAPSHGQAVLNSDNTITYTPDASYDGSDSFSYDLSNGSAFASAVVYINNDRVLIEGSAVSGTLDQESSPAANWVSFKSLPDEGATDFLGVDKGVATGSKSVMAIFNAAGATLLKVGDTVPGTGGATIGLLEAPSGGVLIAKLKTGTGSPAVTVATEEVLLDLTSGTSVLVARTGEAPSNFVSFMSADRSVYPIDENSNPSYYDAVYFTAKVAPAGSTPVVTLWVSYQGNAPVELAAPGMTINGQVLKSFSALKGGTGTAAQERNTDDQANLYARLTFANNQESLGYFQLGSFGFNPIATTGDVASGSGFYGSFGLPAPGSYSTIAFAATVTGSGVTSANKKRIYFDGGLAAQSGSPAPGAGGALFFAFSDPATGGSSLTGGSEMAFIAKLSGAGLTSANDTGIWTSTLNGGLPPGLVPAAIAGHVAPGANGGIYASFTSVAVPNWADGTPSVLFTAKLALGGNINKTNSFGLWAVDYTNTVDKIVQTGDLINAGPFTAAVKSFTALGSAGGTAGSGRGIDEDGHVYFIATFTNGKSALLRATLPTQPPQSTTVLN